ncbi:MAG: imidazoleglycerol-phosphate dehydratase HisB [candidate division WOR-3 bacterium]|nr:imidazoleglycerol-phosphate dehydratase HisB [candidate division WOR-3 bacterium]
MRRATIRRKTKESDIMLELKIEGKGNCDVSAPMGFLIHMLETLCRHSGFDISAKIKGDLHVDQHHIVEDTGLCLGLALSKALGDKKGIRRAGFFIYPMDEALALVAIDLSGRSFLKFSGNFKGKKLGDFEVDTIEDFFAGFVNGCPCALHIKLLSGRSDHHKIEAVFKAFARALNEACQKGKIDVIPSTKGIL